MTGIADASPDSSQCPCSHCGSLGVEWQIPSVTEQENVTGRIQMGGISASYAQKTMGILISLPGQKVTPNATFSSLILFAYKIYYHIPYVTDFSRES